MNEKHIASPEAYSSPVVSDLGTLADVTLTAISKTGVSGDVIVINGQSIPTIGSTVTP